MNNAVFLFVITYAFSIYGQLNVLPYNLNDTRNSYQKINGTFHAHKAKYNSTQNAGGRIVGGLEALSRWQFNYQASLRYNGRHFCGGTIIDPRHVLTAAHCVVTSGEVIPTNSLSVVVGDLYINRPSPTTLYKPVTHIFAHEKYSGNTLQNDVAVLRINGSFGSWTREVESIRLSIYTPPNGQLSVVSGWGSTYSNGNPTNELRYVSVPIISMAVCKVSYGENAIKDGMLCAGNWTGGQDACQGDSGGPLVFNMSVVGIVSWGNGCGKPEFPGVYTDVWKYKKWIETQISRSSAETPFMNGFSIILTILCSFYMN